MPTIKRCDWCMKDEMYMQYHDEEWGKPVYDDTVLFEFLVLESFQAGLSWHTVLKKRENFRKAFAQFNAVKISKFDAQKVEKLMQDAGIIRNLVKIEAAVNNAKCFLAIQQEFGSLNNYVWGFVNHQPIVNSRKNTQNGCHEKALHL